MPSLIFAKTIGIGASPMKMDVGLGNETNTSNDIEFEFTIYNTGETRTRVVPDYTVDENLKNFSRPLLDEIIIEPDSTEKFPILFFRNGTEEKRLNITLRFVAEPNETIPEGMLAVRPATDIRINLWQMPMIFEEEKKIPDIVFWILIVAIICIIIIGLVWFRKKF